VTFPLELGPDELAQIQAHLDRRCTLIGEGSSAVLWQDRVFGMVLGAAKAAGYGKKGKK
jgi:hypothetical protein